MIEVLKQALDALKDVGVLTDREWQAVHKNKANELRQAIAELESQEPVATVTSETGADITMSWWHEPALPLGTKLYTHPPQRTWVGLTKEDKDLIEDLCDMMIGDVAFSTIDAILKGKKHMNAEDFYKLYQEYLHSIDDTDQNSILITDRANADAVLWRFYNWLKEKNT